MTLAPLPPQVVASGTMDQRIRQLAELISRKADNTREPAFSAVLLTAPGGKTYRVTVTDAGALITALVPR